MSRRRQYVDEGEGFLLFDICQGQRDSFFSPIGLIESMMGLRPKQGNLRLVFRLFSLIRGLPSIRLE